MRTWLRRVLWGPLLGLILVHCVPVSRTDPETNPARSVPVKPAWCRALPRPEYRSLERVGVTDPWFEVYRVAPGTFAIYEPHQAEEVISYLIVGAKQAALFDTGMGISDIQKLTAELTALPIVVVNSHTHHDHVGGNWQFTDVLGMDTAFTRASAKGTTAGAQDELGPDMICGELPRGDPVHAGPHARCGLPARSPAWFAVHRRHLLPRADLAVSTRNRSRCVRHVRPATRPAHFTSHDGPGRAQRADRTAPDPAPAGQRLRRCSVGAGSTHDGGRQAHIPRGRDIVRAARSAALIG
jgi:hypothetical protein